MAKEAKLYYYLWCPEEFGITNASELIVPLRGGLALLRAEPERLKNFNPANGWGSYAGLVEFVADYLAACEANPAAEVSVSR